MKITLEFTDPRDARAALDAHLYRGMLCDMAEFLRRAHRHSEGVFTLAQVKATAKDLGNRQNPSELVQQVQHMILETASTKLAHLAEEAGVDLYE